MWEERLGTQAGVHLIEGVRLIRGPLNTGFTVVRPLGSSWNNGRSAAEYFFNEIRGVWIADETLSRVFDISSQLKQKLGSKWRSQIVKDRVSKPPSRL